MAKTSEELWEDALSLLPSIAQWATLAVPIVLEMNHRLKEHPETPCFYEIVYPGTSVPVFTEDQAMHLEDALREIWNIDEELEEEEELPKQVGGALPPQIKFAAETLGTARKTIMDALSADNLSPDAWFAKFKHFIRTELPELALKIKEMGEVGGLTMFETVLPDIHGVLPVPIPIPPFTIPIPYQIPSKFILPLLSAFLDILRFTISIVPFVGTLTSLPFTLLLAMIELGKGKLYESLLTLFGLIGTNGIVLGMIAKLVLGAIVLLQPALDQIPDTLLDAGYKTGKASILAFILQFFATIAPDMIRLPLTTFTEVMKQAARVYNQTVSSAIDSVAATTQDKVHLEAALIDIHQIPSFMDILSIQRLAQNPAFIAYPGVIDIVEQLRKIPPFPMLIDLFNIPRKESPEFQQMVAENPPGSIAKKFTPHLKVKDPQTGEYVDVHDLQENTFQSSVPSVPASVATNTPASLTDAAASVPASLTASIPTSFKNMAKTLKSVKIPTASKTRKNSRIKQ